jgi:hypothetical protein
MGADKNFSPKRELGLCPKFTTKDSHTSLPRSRSHNRPTNPRNKHKRSRSESETQEAKNLAALRSTRRTIRKHRADRPRGLGGFRGAAVDRPKITPEPLVLQPQ